VVRNSSGNFGFLREDSCEKQTLLASAGKQSKALDADLADLSGLTRIRRDDVNDLGFVNQTHEDWDPSRTHPPLRSSKTQISFFSAVAPNPR
jgi:hypothetical protein